MDNENKINNLINDLKKAINIEKTISEISTTKIKSPVDELLSYAIKYGIINNTNSLLKICKELPEIEDKITKMYDENIAKKLENNNYSSCNNNYGSRLQDMPGYGTIWNERCIPDNIKRISNRCGEHIGMCRC